MRIIRNILCLSLLVLPLISEAQQDSLDWEKLSLESDLLDQYKIKKEKNHVLAPTRSLDSLASTALDVVVINRSTIIASGATRIVHLLELVPGFNIREQTNGVFDIDYTGIRQRSPGIVTSDDYYSIILLLDGQPYNDAFTGDIFWEAIPIAVSSLERVEVIRTPHGAWQSTTSGLVVINLVSQQPATESDLLVSGMAAKGNLGSNTYEGRANVSLTEKLSMSLGGFFRESERSEKTYYTNSGQKSVQYDSLMFYEKYAETTNPYAELANRSMAIQLAARYLINDSSQIAASTGRFESLSQGRFYINKDVPLTFRQRNAQFYKVAYSSPFWTSSLHYSHGETDYQKGYEDHSFLIRRAFANVAYNRKFDVGRFSVGTDILADFARRADSSSVKAPLPSNVKTPENFSRLLPSLYFIEQLSLLKGSLLIDAAQRIYFTDEVRFFRYGHHLAIKEMLSRNTYLKGAVSKVRLLPQQLYTVDTLSSFSISTYEAGFYTGFQDTRFSLKAFRRFAGQKESSLVLPASGAIAEISSKLNGVKFSLFGSYHAGFKEYDPYLGGGLSVDADLFLNRVNIFTLLQYRGDYQQNEVIPVPYMHNSRSFMVNFNASYRVWEMNRVFVQARNLFNHHASEVPFGDSNSRRIVAGLNFIF